MLVYRVNFCCNDDRGNFTGRTDAVDVGDEISLAGPSRALTFLGDDCVKVSRRRFRCAGRNVWCGNLFWDATSMNQATAVSLVRYLIADCGWSVEQYAEDGPFAALARSAA